jgi:D-alanyl-D-alanine carboxypeptidase
MELPAQLDAAIEKVMKEANVPGAVVGISIPGKIDYAKAFGTSNRATNKPMSLAEHVRVGSVTKTFIGTAILQLVDQGKLQLADPISKYIDGVPQGDKITLQMLGDMRSGIFPYTSDEGFLKRFQETFPAVAYSGPPPFTPQELVDYGIKHPLNFAPNTKYEYSNTNTVLLGLVMEEVTGQPLSEYLAQNVFAPAKLANTSFPNAGDMPIPYAHGETNWTPDNTVADATLWNPSWGRTAGAVVSTFADLKTWALVLGKGTLLKPATQQARLQFQQAIGGMSYGFAIFHENGWIGHNGRIPGYTTVVVSIPTRDATLVVNATTDITTQDEKSNAAGLIAKAVTTVATPNNVYTIDAGS